ncbi:MAG: BON domain-containing protein [Litorimonas sp.]
MFKPVALFAVLMLSAAHLSGCAVASAGLKKGDERSFVSSLNDVNAGRAIEARLKRAYAYEMGGVDVEVAEGVVLLTGNVPRQEDRIEAARIAWSAANIDQVGNEIMIQDKQGIVRNTKDGVLEKSVRARLTADKYVKGINYNIETHDGIVYLMGVARDPGELERAAKIASLTRGAREVISYVRIADVPIEMQVAAQAQAPTQRALPNFLRTEPMPEQDRSDVPAPMRQAPMDESVPYRTPQIPVPYDLGESDNPFNADPNAPPFYIDPDTGEQIAVKNWIPPTNEYMGD